MCVKTSRLSRIVFEIASMVGISSELALMCLYVMRPQIARFCIELAVFKVLSVLSFFSDNI